MLELGKVYSLSELIEAAHEAERLFNGQALWFRGHAQHDWKLVPSAHRRHATLESEFTNHFRLKAPSIVANCPEHKNYTAWLPLMQHYGLPTRLLDWTESLSVAAFFAVLHNPSTEDAVIWTLAPGSLNEQSIGDQIPFLADERVNPMVKAAFTKQSAVECQHPLAVLAPRSDRRMAAQLGNYTIHGNRCPLEAHQSASEFLAKIIIPANAHNKIKSDLSIFGMQLSSLFPDLSNLAKEISEIEYLGDLEE